jgi:transcription elongation factor SPT5
MSSSSSSLSDQSPRSEAPDSEYEAPRKRKFQDLHQTARKRKKLSAKHFVEMSASSGEEEEEEADPEYLEELKEAERYEAELRKTRSASKFQSMSAEDLADYYSKLARTQPVDENYNSSLSKQSRLPSIEDPKLWMINCRKKMERRAVIALMSKAIHQNRVKQCLEIFSVFTSDHVKEAVYVEAYKKVHVLNAVKGLSMLYPNSVNLVPLSEMSEVFNMDKVDKLPVSEGSFVRIKFGQYKGDLAQVVYVEKSSREITVKIVPRLDQSGSSSKIKPIARLFNPNDYPGVDIKRDPLTGEMYHWYKGNSYKDGFLIKSLKARSLIVENVVPSLAETKDFNSKVEEEEAALSRSLLVRKVHFVAGDKVKIVVGDLKNLIATVFSVSNGELTLTPNIAELEHTSIIVKQNEVVKYFEVGDSVKVVGGRAAGLSGLIVSASTKSAEVMAADNQVAEVLFTDMQSSGDINISTSTGQKFRINDIVKMSDGGVGLVLQVTENYLHIMQTNGDTANALYSEAAHRYPPFRTSSIDAKGTVLKEKDVVKVVNPVHTLFDKTGTILNCLKGTLFIFIPQMIGNKIFPVKASQCLMAGTEFDEVQRESESLAGKLVYIKLGPYRGKKGRILDIKGKSAIVCLEPDNKKVILDTEAIEDQGAREVNAPPSAFQQPAHATPSHNFGTPMYESGSPYNKATPKNSWWASSPSTIRRD